MLTTNARRIIFAFFVSFLACACTARDLYSAGQGYQREQCRSGPPTEFEQCMKQANESFETYQRKKREVDETQ